MEVKENFRLTRIGQRGATVPFPPAFATQKRSNRNVDQRLAQELLQGLIYLHGLARFRLATPVLPSAQLVL